jgi:hypothetical protein
VWVLEQTKQEYDRRRAAGDSEEQIFRSLRTIVAQHLTGAPAPETPSASEPATSKSVDATPQMTEVRPLDNDSTTSEVESTDDSQQEVIPQVHSYCAKAALDVSSLPSPLYHELIRTPAPARCSTPLH